MRHRLVALLYSVSIVMLSHAHANYGTMAGKQDYLAAAIWIQLHSPHHQDYSFSDKNRYAKPLTHLTIPAGQLEYRYTSTLTNAPANSAALYLNAQLVGGARYVDSKEECQAADNRDADAIRKFLSVAGDQITPTNTNIMVCHIGTVRSLITFRPFEIVMEHSPLSKRRLNPSLRKPYTTVIHLEHGIVGQCNIYGNKEQCWGYALMRYQQPWQATTFANPKARYLHYQHPTR